MAVAYGCSALQRKFALGLAVNCRIQAESLVEGVVLGKSPNRTCRVEPDDRNAAPLDEVELWIFRDTPAGWRQQHGTYGNIITIASNRCNGQLH
jgi:hypothetical protein